MSNIINILKNEGQLVVTSREVSTNFEKEHSSVVVRAIENLIKELEGSGQNCTHLFIETKYQNEQNKQWYKEYLLTRDGFSLLVMGFTGQKALQWKMKYIDAFNKMETSLKKPKEPMHIVQLLHAEVGELIAATSEIETRVGNLENNMTIDYAQQLVLQEIAKSVAIESMGGKDTPAYKDSSLRAKVFAQVWKDYKGYFEVNSYKNTARIEFDKAKEYLKGWKTQGKILREIEDANSQTTLIKEAN